MNLFYKEFRLKKQEKIFFLLSFFFFLGGGWGGVGLRKGVGAE